MIVCGGGKGEEEGGGGRGLEKKPEQAPLGRGRRFPSLPVVGAREPEAAVSHSQGFHSCSAPELCVIQKLSKTMAIPLSKTSFSVSVVLSITAVCRNTAQGTPEKKKKKEAGACRV